MRQIDLKREAEALGAYDHLERFSNRWRTPLGGIYRVSRRLVISILNDYHDAQTDRDDTQLFAAVAARHIDYRGRLVALLALRPFAYTGVPEPFEPVGIALTPRVEAYRNHALALLGLAVRVRNARNTPAPPR